MRIYTKSGIIKSKVRHWTIGLDFNSGKRAEFALGWNINKGDWWYEDSPLDRKVAWFKRMKYGSSINQIAFYFCRLSFIATTGYPE